uniref:Uncharacterized protein n=1 Tax=Rhizophora mucronata TaxID=61149 RepID=A0A2P2PAK5_RHIMU
MAMVVLWLQDYSQTNSCSSEHHLGWMAD